MWYKIKWIVFKWGRIFNTPVIIGDTCTGNKEIDCPKCQNQLEQKGLLGVFLHFMPQV
jgi:hypothetical protein